MYRNASIDILTE